MVSLKASKSVDNRSHKIFKNSLNTRNAQTVLNLCIIYFFI